MKRESTIGPALLLAGIALVAGITAGLGVFARGDGSVQLVTSERGVPYEMATSGVYAYNAERVVAEGVGWDVFTLAVAVPALLVASFFVARGSFRGRLFALGLLGYFLYAYLEYAVTWAFGPLFLAFVAIYGASLLGILWIGGALVRDGLGGRFAETFPRRSWAILNVAMAALLTILWLGRIAAGLGGDLVTAGLTSETTLTVQALDLGLMVPLSVLGAVLVWRRTDVGYAFAAAWSVTFVAMSAAIMAMLLSAFAVEGTLEIVPIAIFGLAASAGIVIGIRAYQSIESTDPAPAAERHAAGAGRPGTVGEVLS
jgi:hypothetical protein